MTDEQENTFVDLAPLLKGGGGNGMSAEKEEKGHLLHRGSQERGTSTQAFG